jgi:hypothetical protein
MKTLNLAVKLVGTLLLLALALTLGDNALAYFGHGGLKGSVSSVIFAAVSYGLAAVLIGVLFVQLWKLKL